MLTELVEHAVRTVGDNGAAVSERTNAAQLLALSGAPQTVAVLLPVIDPAQPEELQLFALDTLAGLTDPRIADRLADAWQRSTPAVQEAILRTLSSRTPWAVTLLAACRAGRIGVGQVSASTRASLVNHDDEAVRTAATELFADDAGPRSDVIARYEAALSLTGDPARGEQVYQRECTACHRLGERGFQVGPNLALVRNRTDKALLEAILDPNREVQPRYVNYVVVDNSGRTITGLVAAETAASLTLARDKGVRETVLKQEIDQVKSTGQSLMPVGLEKNIDPQSMADLLVFLNQVRYDIGTLPDFVEPED